MDYKEITAFVYRFGSRLLHLALNVVQTKGEQKHCADKLGRVQVEYIYNPLTIQCDRKSSLANNNLIFVGRLEYDVKGLDYLIRIFAKVKQTVPNTKLMVIGDGTGRKIFENQIKAFGLDDCVHMVGTSSDVQRYYLDSSLCLLPSRWEGFGLVVTEAMECGLPVVSFKTEGPSEIIENGKNGYLIDKFDVDAFADKVIYLLANENARHQFGEAARKMAKDFSLESIMKKWNEIL